MELEDLCKVSNNIIDPKLNINILIIKELYSEYELKLIKNRNNMLKSIERLSRKHKNIISMSKALFVYRFLASKSQIIYNIHFEKLLRTKNMRSLSGVVIITVWTAPYLNYTSKSNLNSTKNESELLKEQMFSCEYDCHYCPKEPGQPRSYLLKEPGVLRANANNFISTNQFWDRAKAYILMGHPLDKIELIVSGGTISSYPKEYLIEFFRDQYYAANVVYDKITNNIKLRSPLSLLEEEYINQHSSLVKIIGITIETRPDRINIKEMIFFRSIGVTRVQIGVQHIDDRILEYINRKCNNNHTIRAIQMLKDSGFKVDIHIMPDLPVPENLKNDIIELDRLMFDQIINLSEYQADQWKIYPCETVPWTKIESWYKEGKYKPYGEIILSDGSNPLFELLLEVKSKVKPWVRLNRIIRDIPNSYIIGGNSNTSMRHDLLTIMSKRKIICKCIRCREVKSKEINLANFKIKIREYKASNGIEYFISWEDETDTLLGFLRLRICSNIINNYFPELSGCTLIRELHIYGQVINHNVENNGIGIQHIGLGKNLINKAIELTKKHNLNKIAVIAGTGTRNYYIKLGFKAINTYTDLELNTQIAHGKYLIRTLDNLDNLDYINKIYNIYKLFIFYYLIPSIMLFAIYQYNLF